MLSKRIIGAVLMDGDLVIQSREFGNYIPVGKPEITVDYFSRWGADEILLIDISRTKRGLEPNYQLIENCSVFSGVPLAYGGAVSSLKIARRVFLAGADKIVVNSAASSRLIGAISESFGSQSVVLSVDILKVGDSYHLYNYLTRQCSAQTLEEYVALLNSWGIGEILIQLVNRDGIRCGFDIDLTNRISSQSNVPIIVLGGAGNSKHFSELFKNTTAEAGAAANYFHFTEHSIAVLKSLLAPDQIVRNDSFLEYPENSFDSHDRLKKLDDKVLDSLYYHKIVVEKI
jgi:cyclase